MKYSNLPPQLLFDDRFGTGEANTPCRHFHFCQCCRRQSRNVLGIFVRQLFVGGVLIHSINHPKTDQRPDPKFVRDQMAAFIFVTPKCHEAAEVLVTSNYIYDVSN